MIAVYIYTLFSKHIDFINNQSCLQRFFQYLVYKFKKAMFFLFTLKSKQKMSHFSFPVNVLILHTQKVI